MSAADWQWHLSAKQSSPCPCSACSCRARIGAATSRRRWPWVARQRRDKWGACSPLSRRSCTRWPTRRCLSCTWRADESVCGVATRKAMCAAVCWCCCCSARHSQDRRALGKWHCSTPLAYRLARIRERILYVCLSWCRAWAACGCCGQRFRWRSYLSLCSSRLWRWERARSLWGECDFWCHA